MATNATRRRTRGILLASAMAPPFTEPPGPTGTPSGDRGSRLIARSRGSQGGLAAIAANDREDPDRWRTHGHRHSL